MIRSTSPRRCRKRLLFACGAILAALVVLGTPAQAHQKRHKHHGHDRHHPQMYYSGHDLRPAYRTFAVPARIRRHDRDYYGRFFAGSVYYRPHRHVHAVYSFPVATRNGYTYRPFQYCGSERFVAPAPRPPRAAVRFDIRF